MSMIPHKWFLVFAALLASATAVGAQCLEDSRAAPSNDAGVRLKQYLCKVGNEGQPSLQVEFHRLVEPGATLLLTGASLGSLRATFGTPRIVKNAVWRELQDLSSRFGRTFSYGRDFELKLAAPTAKPKGDDDIPSDRIAGKYDHPDLYGGPGSTDGKASAKMQLKSIKSIHADYNIETDVDYPALAEVQAVMSKSDWPAGFNMTYSRNGDELAEEVRLQRDAPQGAMVRGFVRRDASRDIPFEVTLWKGMSKADLDAYAGRIRELNAYIARQARKTRPEGVSKAKPGYLEFLRHVTRDAMPTDFLIMTGTIDEGCGDSSALCCWKFTFYQRAIAVTMAVIRNVSSKSLKLDGLLGTQRATPVLRAATARIAQPSSLLEATTIELKPNESVVVPLGLALIDANTAMGGRGDFGSSDMAMATKIYQRIRATPQGTIFERRFEKRNVTKSRESFEAPTQPKKPDYAYGPEVELTGVSVDGTRIDFKTQSPNFLALTIGEGYGSCPFVYSWSSTEKLWTNHGKVLDKAQGKDKQQIDAAWVAGLRLRWRIAEHEPEVAHIGEARLILDLKDGRSVVLKPSFGPLAGRVEARGRNALVLLWGEHADLSFRLPVGVRTASVITSRLELNGYYERYGQVAER
jgi:hypothetical protein